MADIAVKKQAKRPSKQMAVLKRDLHHIDAKMTMSIGDVTIHYDLEIQITQDLLMHSHGGRVSSIRALYYTLGRMMAKLLKDDDDSYELEMAIQRGLACEMKTVHHDSMKHHIRQESLSPTLAQAKEGCQDA